MLSFSTISLIAFLLRLRSIRILTIAFLILLSFQSVRLSTVAFFLLFAFRYVRFVVHAFAYLHYRPTPLSTYPVHSPSDVTAIIPTVNPKGSEFEDTVKSLLGAGCPKVIVVTIKPHFQQARKLCKSINPDIDVLCSKVANKRSQLVLGLRKVRTGIVLFADDHIWFEQPFDFVRSVLAPFDDPLMGGVAVGKRVRREQGLGWFSIADMLNFIACLYLDRRNFDQAASNSVDGGISVISGRCAAYRSSVVCDEAFIDNFCNDFWFFGYGPLNADDDKCITRWLVNNGWKIKFQYSPIATAFTCLGIEGFRKYNTQCLRWARSSWRSNSVTLIRDRTVWITQPWCIYAVYISSFFNFALFTDAAMITVGHRFLSSPDTFFTPGMNSLIKWILFTKIAKLIPHFIRHPADIVYFPVYVLFAYYHSFVKLWALCTITTLSWGSRPNVA